MRHRPNVNGCDVAMKIKVESEDKKADRQAGREAVTTTRGTKWGKREREWEEKEEDR